MCVSVLKLLHSQERSGLLLKDHAERLDWAETFMSVCVDKVFQEMQNYSFYEAAVPMLLMCKHMMEESDGLDSAIVAVICNNLALLYQARTLTLCTLRSPPPLTSICAFSETRQARPSACPVQPIRGGALKALWTRLLARGRLLQQHGQYLLCKRQVRGGTRNSGEMHRKSLEIRTRI